MAGRAGVGDVFACTMAARTGLLHTEKSLPHLHHATAMTGIAGLGRSAGLGTTAMTGFAIVPAWNADLCFLASSSLFQRDVHGIAQVVAALHLAAATSAARLTEDVAEDVAEAFEPAKSARKPAAAHVWINTGVTVLVIGGALLAVGQYFVGLLDLFEFGLSLLGCIPLVTVRVILHRQLAVGFLDFIIAGIARHPQHFVIVAFGHGQVLSISMWAMSSSR